MVLPELGVLRVSKSGGGALGPKEGRALASLFLVGSGVLSWPGERPFVGLFPCPCPLPVQVNWPFPDIFRRPQSPVSQRCQLWESTVPVFKQRKVQTTREAGPHRDSSGGAWRPWRASHMNLAPGAHRGGSGFWVWRGRGQASGRALHEQRPGGRTLWASLRRHKGFS